MNEENNHTQLILTEENLADQSIKDRSAKFWDMVFEKLKSLCGGIGRSKCFFFADDEVRYDLPIFPEYHETINKSFSGSKNLSCAFCGHTQSLEPANQYTCPKCKEDDWTFHKRNSGKIMKVTW